ncbi:DUF5302 domain-containing protein [Smaragdicoccus niigatensis]|uniref:DUF5302 domain-containing protein n=1 Tax=Smaragdicoccus niigatensis TaxID=359359 RepID=UPI000364ED7C|nr:DUF5302 domain-containing protein [Smaragdicoccus niigatensis]
MSEPSKRSSADDVKAKFKEALDRKRAQSKSGAAHQDGVAKAQGAHGAVAARREFRRKSG